MTGERRFANETQVGAIEKILLLAALQFSIAILAGIVGLLISEWAASSPIRLDRRIPHRHAVDAAVRRRALRHPAAGRRHAVTTTVALLVAVPLGTIIAHLPERVRSRTTSRTVKPILELLGAVPTVVYGYFALLFVTPLLQRFMPDLPGFNMLSAGLVIGIMIVPYVSSVSEDAMRAVPMHMREGSYAMGATRHADGACA